MQAVDVSSESELWTQAMNDVFLLFLDLWSKIFQKDRIQEDDPKLEK